MPLYGGSVKELKTNRLVLRSFTTEDAEFIFDMYSRWDVQRFIGRAPRVMADASEARVLADRYAAFEHPVLGIWAIADKTDGTLFGTLLLKPLPASGSETPLAPSDDIEIGWHLHPDAWGHGYASEAAQGVLAHAFSMGLGRVLAVTNKDNFASQAVAGRIGMSYAGRTRDYYNCECELFSIEPK
ncbi:GNAT family N-acetyltransferase [Saxibacter everestensis]|uniref:GNAT family N-acetyltransferase n=1 Tax=Saxibacter everestensis TaxID=2909229 RepID=A0ABY8QPV9_9MICO|nr:GNAT family N-acetyltransferase [Brevibacteriaceae bacterium ZFBP1038]